MRFFHYEFYLLKQLVDTIFFKVALPSMGSSQNPLWNVYLGGGWDYDLNNISIVKNLPDKFIKIILSNSDRRITVKNSKLLDILSVQHLLFYKKGYNLLKFQFM